MYLRTASQRRRDSMNSAGPRRSSSAWSTAGVIVAAVALGMLAGGLLNDPQPDSGEIRGCDDVVQPDDTHRIDYAFVEDKRYANPDYGWFSEAKAETMSDTLRASLPSTAEVLPYSIYTPLQFQPFGSETTAQGLIAFGGEEGNLTVVVQQSSTPPGPCILGYVDERRTFDDGAVIDTSDGEHGRRARAYTPDGSLIDVSITGALTVEQLAVIAAAPGLRIR